MTCFVSNRVKVGRSGNNDKKRIQGSFDGYRYCVPLTGFVPFQCTSRNGSGLMESLGEAERGRTPHNPLHTKEILSYTGLSFSGNKNNN